MDALNLAAEQLDGDGLDLPSSGVHIWYAEGETTIDEEGIVKLENGVRADELETIRMASDWHSWIRGTGRPRTEDEALQEDADGNPKVYTDDDDALREEQFDYMIELLLN
jgi:hypothetical protein